MSAKPNNSDSDLNFEDLDKAFENIDKELEDLVGNTKKNIYQQAVKKNKDEEIDEKESDSAAKQQGGGESKNVSYCLSSNLLTSSPAEIFKKISMLEFVMPGQLLLVQQRIVNNSVLYYPGKNVVMTEDFSRFYSTVKGIVSWRGRYLTVEEMDIIDEEIPVGVGQLNYEKSVFIKGKVANGVKIRSKGDIYIEQNIGDVDIYAEGNIYFMNGITSHGKSKITSKESVYSRFIENSNVRAGNNVIIEESAVNSNIVANNCIDLVGRKQIIVGGSCSVGSFINCKVIGSENFTTTNLTAGLLGDEKDELEKGQNRLVYIKKRSVELDKKLSAFVVKKANGQLTETEQKELDEGKEEKNNLKEEEKKITEMIKSTEIKIAERKDSRINAEEKVYPGINIYLNKQIYNVQKEMHKISFILKDNAVVAEKFSRKPLTLNFAEKIDLEQNKINFVDYKKIRRSFISEGKSVQDLMEKACYFLDLSKEQLVNITINKTDNDYKIAFFEVKKGENPIAVRKKAMQVVSIERIQAIGATIEECLLKASKSLGLPPAELEYRIIQEGAKGVLGFGKKDFILEVTKKKAKKVMHLDEKPIDGKIELKNTIEGLMLKITRPRGSGKTVEIEDVHSLLESKKYHRDIDKKLIEEAVKNADDEAVKIAPRQPELELDGKFEIEISQDKLAAYVKIIPPKKGGVYPNIVEIEHDLQQRDIKNINAKELVESFSAANNKEYKVQVAQGKPVSLPVPPKVELKFENTADKKEIGDEQIDFKSISSIVNVIEGHLLAVIQKSIPGEAGIDVFGNEIPVSSPPEVPIKPGKNVRVSDDGSKYFAQIEGWVMFENNVLKVEDVYQINGDVDYNTGNISSLGTVIIKGAVKDGFKVEATGDIIVNAVEAAELIAEGSIIIKAGIQGKGTASIKAKGNIYAKFIEQSNVESEGSVIVTDSIMHSSILAKSDIIVVKGKKGLLCGGKYRAGTVIACKNIGSKVATATTLEVGYDPYVKKELESVQTKLNILKNEYLQTRLNLQRLVNEIKGNEARAPQEKKDLLKKLTERYQKMSLELRELNNHLQRLQVKLRENKKGYIFAKEKVFTNIEINIRNLTYKVREEISFCTFYDDNGEIKWKEFDEIWLNKNSSGVSQQDSERQKK
ncbi:MAG TPA: FapA family protein [bacterium]|nr:FapA family protein [bacterium]